MAQHPIMVQTRIPCYICSVRHRAQLWLQLFDAAALHYLGTDHGCRKTQGDHEQGKGKKL